MSKCTDEKRDNINLTLGYCGDIHWWIIASTHKKIKKNLWWSMGHRGHPETSFCEAAYSWWLIFICFKVATESRIHCSKCDNKLGSFSWVGPVSCGCGGSITPGFWLNLSRVDKCIMRKDVEAVIWNQNVIFSHEINSILMDFAFNCPRRWNSLVCKVTHYSQSWELS